MITAFTNQVSGEPGPAQLRAARCYSALEAVKPQRWWRISMRCSTSTMTRRPALSVGSEAALGRARPRRHLA
jgi:hypothetical protein